MWKFCSPARCGKFITTRFHLITENPPHPSARLRRLRTGRATIERFAGIGEEALFYLLVILPDQAFAVAVQVFGDGGDTRGKGTACKPVESHRSRKAVLVRTLQHFLNLLLNLRQPISNRFPDQVVIHTKVKMD